MAQIKSAWEIALEKTEGIKGDKTSLAAAAGKEEGKKLASRFFQDPTLDLPKALKELPQEKLPFVKEGFFQVVLTHLALPRSDEDLAKLDPMAKALEGIIKDKGKIKYLKEQLEQFLKQCLQDKKQLAEAIAKQLGPVLKQKEAQLARQYGRPVRIDPMTDADYAKAYNQNMGNLESRYGEVLAQVKAELTELFDQSK